MTKAPTLDDRTLAVLEYPAVLERLAGHTSFSPGRELALALRPVADREAVIRRQRETAEAVGLAAAGVQVSLGGARDVRTLVSTAARGAVLTPSQLLEVADTVRAAERVRRTLTRLSAEAPLLSTTAAGIADCGALRGLIEQSIDDRGEVTDGASADLGQIRRELTVAHDRLQQRMEALLRSPVVRTALQDPIVTIRDGRYVLPVRSESRAVVPGVVHDSSASGATVYVEPLAVVELGNRWRELQVQERREVERILRELSEAVGEAADELLDAVARLAAVDLALAKARLATELEAVALAATGEPQRWIVEAPAVLRLVDARHPLLAGEVVPVSLEVGSKHLAVLITGPNTGGKTVALKTAGLLTLMALAGLPVPAAEGTRIPAYDAVFADIGDEQSIEQSLSTFSGHVTAVIDILERADDRALVLLDELGAGTDPAEGSALAIAIVERLIEAGVTLVATTHHSELKLYAHRSARVVNASVEFDMETLSPTYRLTMGLPGQSNALAIAERLGMPPGVISRARDGLSTTERDVESVLTDLRAQLTTAERRAAAAAAARDQAEALRTDLERQLAELAAESAEYREAARERVRAELREAERLVERTLRDVEAARMEQATADLERARAAAAALAPTASTTPAPPSTPAAPPPPGADPAAEPAREPAGGPAGRPVPLLPGNAVWLRGIPSPGEVLTAPDAAGEFEVMLGALRTRVRTTQVVRTGRHPESAGARIGAMPQPPADVPEEIEVRGQRVDEALPGVEAFLDDAARAGRVRVRIIHGKGTGTLRRAVRELLAGHPLVTSFETGHRAEGGEGVTVAHLAGTAA